jgi:hypothetical protein
MENLRKYFDVGVWVVLNETYIEYIEKRFGKKSETFIRKNQYPQIIKKIYKGDNILKSTVLEFYSGSKVKVRGTEFRFATEKEIKEQEIRNIFLKNKPI